MAKVAIIFFQSDFDGFCMMLCDHNVKMVKIDFISGAPMADNAIKAWKTNVERRPLRASACRFHKPRKKSLSTKKRRESKILFHLLSCRAPCTRQETRKAHKSLCLQDGFGE